MNELLNIPLVQIKDNEVALRAVNKQTQEYLGLVDSIRARGVLNPINVRAKRDEAGNPFYEIVDGLHRVTASREAGLAEIPAQVLTINDADVMEAQIVANVHKVETKPVEYTKQLQRILALNPTMTMSDLASKIHKQAGWISQRFNLLKLDPKIQKLVDENKITLSNAYALSKLDCPMQGEFVDRAMTETPEIFIPAVNQRSKEVRDARRAGREAAPVEFQAVPHLRKISIIKEEMVNPTILTSLIQKNQITDPVAAAKYALTWALNMDEDSVAFQKAKYEEHKAQQKAERERIKKEKEEKKAAEANTEAAKVTA